MFGKAISPTPGWEESPHPGGSLQPSFPRPENPEPGQEYPPNGSLQPSFPRPENPEPGQEYPPNGSLEPSFPWPDELEEGRYYPLTPRTEPTKETPSDRGSVPPVEYAEGTLATPKQSLWPLLLLGVAAYVLLK